MKLNFIESKTVLNFIANIRQMALPSIQHVSIFDGKKDERKSLMRNKTNDGIKLMIT